MKADPGSAIAGKRFPASRVERHRARVRGWPRRYERSWARKAQQRNGGNRHQDWRLAELREERGTA
jgi:hypothetical protein